MLFNLRAMNEVRDGWCASHHPFYSSENGCDGLSDEVDACAEVEVEVSEVAVEKKVKGCGKQKVDADLTCCDRKVTSHCMNKALVRSGGQLLSGLLISLMA